MTASKVLYSIASFGHMPVASSSPSPDSFRPSHIQVLPHSLTTCRHVDGGSIRGGLSKMIIFLVSPCLLCQLSMVHPLVLLLSPPLYKLLFLPLPLVLVHDVSFEVTVAGNLCHTCKARFYVWSLPPSAQMCGKIAFQSLKLLPDGISLEKMRFVHCSLYFDLIALLLASITSERKITC